MITVVLGNWVHIRSTSGKPLGSIKQLRTCLVSAAAANMAAYPAGSNQRAGGQLL